MERVLDNLTNKTRKELYKDNEPDGFVYLKYHEFISTGKYPYLSQVGDFIKGFLPELTIEQERNLTSHVYYSAELVRHDNNNAYEWAMIADGWQMLDENAARAIVDLGHQKIRCIKRGHNALGFEAETDQIYKIQLGGNGKVYLMKPRARSRGWGAEQFYGAYYKII